jgi:hypothetical protein
MSALSIRSTFGLLVFLSVSAACTALAACSSDASNPQPVYNVTHDGGDAARGVDSSTPKGDGSTPPPVGDGGSGIDATQSDATTSDSGFDAPHVDAASCSTDGGCWSCTPATTPEFLNQCTSSQCVPFDNHRLPNFDGGLPPLGN